MNHDGAKLSFQTTRWTLIRKAAGSQDAQDRAALATFCEHYWYPIYAFFRRSGQSPHDAEDLTQGFFVRLVEKEILHSADPAKGKLRSFLLTCARNFLRDEHDRTHAAKRGAHLVTSLDAARAEERYIAEPADDFSPDRLYQRRWALTVLERAMQQLGDEFAEKGKSAIFAALRPYLGVGKASDQSYEAVAAQLGVPEATLASHVRRMRQRWSTLVSEQVAATLDSPTSEAIRAELSELIGYV